MTKKEKELVQELKSQMPEFKGSKVDIEKRIAMYIYLKLGKSKVFDESFFLADKETKKKIVKLSRIRKTRKDRIIKNRKITCLNIANLYKTLLRDFHIRCLTTRLHPQSDHYYNVIKFSDGSLLVADLQKDMHNIHTGCKTETFGPKYKKGQIIEEGMPQEEIFEIQKDCGYVKDKEDYTDSKIEKLKEKLKDLPPDKTLEGIMTDKEITSVPKDIGYIEFFKYYQKVLKNIAPNYYNYEIQTFNCFRRKENDRGKMEKDYSMCIYCDYNNKLDIYLEDVENKEFKKVKLEELEKLEREGLTLGRTQEESGLQPIRNHMKQMIIDRYSNIIDK